MATTVGYGAPSASWIHLKNVSQGNVKTSSSNTKFRVSCAASSTGSDPYKILRIRRGASENEVRKAFRQLALQYHPDVCKGNDCGVQFHQINEAYDVVMRDLRNKERSKSKIKKSNECVPVDELFRGMNDPDWDLWEEWMGWEGAGIRDYSSHINPYI